MSVLLRLYVENGDITMGESENCMHCLKIAQDYLFNEFVEFLLLFGDQSLGAVNNRVIMDVMISISRKF